MKICDLCGDTNIVVDDGDVQLCQTCKDILYKSNQDAKEGRISKLE